MLFENGHIPFFVHYQNHSGLYIFNSKIIYNKSPGILVRENQIGNPDIGERYHIYYLANHIYENIQDFEEMDLVNEILNIHGFRQESDIVFNNPIVLSSDDFDNANAMKLNIYTNADSVDFEIHQLMLDRAVQKTPQGADITYRCRLSYLDALITLCNLLISPEIALKYENHFESLDKTEFRNKLDVLLELIEWKDNDDLIDKNKAFKDYVDFSEIYLNWIYDRMEAEKIDIEFILFRSGLELLYIFDPDHVTKYLQNQIEYILKQSRTVSEVEFYIYLTTFQYHQHRLNLEYQRKIEKIRNTLFY